MNWREPTADDIAGNGDYRYIIDITPGWVPHQATTDGDALIRIGQHGWDWTVLDFSGKRYELVGSGNATDRYIAIGQAMDFLGSLRS